MGAFQSLFVAATGPTNQYSVKTKGSVLRFLQGKQGVKEVRIDPVTNQLPLINFDRYVAINTPVRLAQGISKLDEFYRAPLDWPPFMALFNSIRAGSIFTVKSATGRSSGISSTPGREVRPGTQATRVYHRARRQGNDSAR